MSLRLAVALLPVLVTGGGCYVAHERPAIRADVGALDASVPAADSAAFPDIGTDASIPPACVMSGGCAGEGLTIVLAHADPMTDGPGCVDIDVPGSDAVDCDGPITPIRIVRCAGSWTDYSATVTSIARDHDEVGIAVYYDEERCRCASWYGGEPTMPESISDGMGRAHRERPVLEIGLLGRGIGYRLRACAIE